MFNSFIYIYIIHILYILRARARGIKKYMLMF